MILSILCKEDVVVDTSPNQANTEGDIIVFNELGYAKNLPYKTYDNVEVPSDYIPDRYTYTPNSGWRMNPNFIDPRTNALAKAEINLARLVTLLQDKGVLDSEDIVKLKGSCVE